MVLAVYFGVSADCKTVLLWAGVFAFLGVLKKARGLAMDMMRPREPMGEDYPRKLTVAEASATSL
jgi:hypothetical protein